MYCNCIASYLLCALAVDLAEDQMAIGMEIAKLFTQMNKSSNNIM